MRAIAIVLLVACSIALSARAEQLESQIESPLAALPSEQTVPVTEVLYVDDDGNVEQGESAEYDDGDDADDDDEDDASDALDDDEFDDNVLDNDLEEDLLNYLDNNVDTDNVDAWKCFSPPCPRSYTPICALVDNERKTIPSECEFNNKVDCAHAMQRMGRTAPVYEFLYEGECDHPFYI